MEVNGTEPSPSVRVPCSDAQMIICLLAQTIGRIILFSLSATQAVK